MCCGRQEQHDGVCRAAWHVQHAASVNGLTFRCHGYQAVQVDACVVLGLWFLLRVTPTSVKLLARDWIVCIASGTLHL